jgi:hypothetical protein
LAVFAATTVVHLRQSAQVGVLKNDFQLRARVPVHTRPVTSTNNCQFPTTASLVFRVKKFRREAVLPLDIELFAFSKPTLKIVRKVQLENQSRSIGQLLRNGSGFRNQMTRQVLVRTTL